MDASCDGAEHVTMLRRRGTHKRRYFESGTWDVPSEKNESTEPTCDENIRWEKTLPYLTTTPWRREQHSGRGPLILLDTAQRAALQELREYWTLDVKLRRCVGTATLLSPDYDGAMYCNRIPETEDVYHVIYNYKTLYVVLVCDKDDKLQEHYYVPTDNEPLEEFT